MPHTMKRSCVALWMVGASIFAACRDEPAAQQGPAPSPAVPAGVPSGVLPPVDRARDAVDELNRLQDQTERQTGDAYGAR